MSKIRLYLDEDAMRRGLANALRMRGVDVLTVHEASLNGHPDDEQLAYATAQGRALFSHNIGDFVALHTAYLEAGQHHAGIVLDQQNRYGIGEQTRRLLNLINIRPAEAMQDQLEFLSAWG